MAEQLAISIGYYGELERGVKQPTFAVITRIIAFSEKDANYWFGMESVDNVLPYNDITQEDISTILSLLHSLSGSGNGSARDFTAAINKDTTIAQLIVIIAQIRAYLSELDLTMLSEPDRRTISDLLAACQRALDGHVHQGPGEGKHLKIINE